MPKSKPPFILFVSSIMPREEADRMCKEMKERLDREVKMFLTCDPLSLLLLLLLLLTDTDILTSTKGGT
jgi:hypothetical protein